MNATCIIVDGPFPDTDRDGEEIATYSVCKADDDGNEVGKVQVYDSYAAAVSQGEEMVRQNPKLELVIEASRF